MEKLKVNGPSPCVDVAAKSADAADGHEATPTRAEAKPSPEKAKPVTKAEQESPVDNTSASSGSSPRHKVFKIINKKQ